MSDPRLLCLDSRVSGWPPCGHRWHEGTCNALAIIAELIAARAALLAIQQATSLPLPSEQTGPEWDQTVRVPVSRLRAIDVAVSSVLGEPAVTDEPMPKLHGGD